VSIISEYVISILTSGNKPILGQFPASLADIVAMRIDVSRDYSGGYYASISKIL
jgi:hypothetical protein